MRKCDPEDWIGVFDHTLTLRALSKSDNLAKFTGESMEEIRKMCDQKTVSPKGYHYRYAYPLLVLGKTNAHDLMGMNLSVFDKKAEKALMNLHIESSVKKATS